MRINVLVFAASLLLISSSSAGIPQNASTATSSPQAATILGQSAKALTGSMAVNDVTLTGTVKWVAGSDEETGITTYKGVSGAYRLDMTFSNGTRSEIVSLVNNVPAGNWIGPDGTSHAMAKHNLMADPGWFPNFTLGNVMSSPNSILTYVGQEDRNGASVIHISAFQQVPNISANLASDLQHLTQIEIYLDPVTLLPASYSYNSHPDDNASLDLATEIRYANYQSVAGTLVPFHIQKYVNNTLAIDLQLESASLNTGITVAQITAQ